MGKVERQGGEPLSQRNFPLLPWALCFVMQSVAGQSCVPHRVAATFLHSTIDSKKKIRYTVPYLHNRFFDNRNSDSCPLSESSKMRSKARSVALISHPICTESLILAQNERWRRT